MSLRTTIFVSGAFWFASALVAQNGPAGHWEGVLSANGRDIDLSLDLAQNDKGEWIASMGVPAQNVTGLVVKDLAVAGNSVKFMAVELQMARLDLTVADGKLSGTIAGPRQSGTIEFKRAGEGKVQLLPASPAVSKDLEGDWTGTLKTPGSEFEITIHFKNQPGDTVLATIDIPATKSTAMPINDVKQAGDKIEFGLKIAQASFQGTLDKDRGELRGQLTHEGQSPMAVALKKK
jgi:hypothetical protein